MKIPFKLRLALIVALGTIFLSGLSGLSGTVAMAQAKPVVKSAPQKPYEQLIFSVRGPDLFKAHCATCHGLDGKGGGPVAGQLKTRPADLTVLAKRNAGKFPAERVGKFIDGQDESIQVHGSREMPVWGPIFHQIEEDQDFGNVRIANLVRYLSVIQQK
jgi:mono/diheme cytochrome c family protein